MEGSGRNERNFSYLVMGIKGAIRSRIKRNLQRSSRRNRIIAANIK